MNEDLLTKCKYVETNKWFEQTTISLKDNNFFLYDCCNLSFKKGDNRQGVYMIGDFYIGKSIDIRKRVLNHFQCSINGRHQNNDLSSKIIDLLLNGEKIPVRILSQDTRKEAFFIHEFVRKGYNLKNKELYNYDEKNVIPSCLSFFENFKF
jgi:hypothetical protein